MEEKISTNNYDPERLQLVAEVLDLYRHEFSGYFALAVTVVEKIPEQVNNEIRNTFTHASRILNSPDIRLAVQEKVQAEKHLKRACRDCLKIVIIHANSRTRALVDVMMAIYKDVPPAINTRLTELEKRRATILLEEAKGTSHTLTKDMEELSVDFQKLYDKVAELYGSSQITAYMKVRLFVSRLSPLWWIIGIILAFFMPAFVEGIVKVAAQECFGLFKE